MATINLEQTYKEQIRPTFMEKGVNIHEAAHITKIVVNVGVGKFAANRRLRGSGKAQSEAELVSDIASMLADITGQKAKVVIARKSIAGFKLREGSVVGLTVTLRGRRMYDLLGRTIHIALPRTRDFRGVPVKGVDQDGNLTIGIRDMTIFPEIAHAALVFGCEITMVTNTKDRKSAMELFEALGIPFEKKEI
ncbi:MAG: 50S ribosomal protein L5 [Candidatus Spechtbacterales bacterium]